METLPSIDMKQLDTAVVEANQNLQTFCQGKNVAAVTDHILLFVNVDNPESGPPALACFIIIALCPLSRRWLYTERTARGM